MGHSAQREWGRVEVVLSGGGGILSAKSDVFLTTKLRESPHPHISSDSFPFVGYLGLILEPFHARQV